MVDIDSILNNSRSRFMNNLVRLRMNNDSTGLSQHLIAEWMGKEGDVVNIVMPIIGWKKIDFAGEVYWFEPDTYEKFRQRIEEYLISEVVNEGCN